MAGLQVKEFCVRVSFSKVSDAGTLPHNSPLERGEPQGAQLGLSSQHQFMWCKCSQILGSIQSEHNLLSNSKLQAH